MVLDMHSWKEPVLDTHWSADGESQLQQRMRGGHLCHKSSRTHVQQSRS